MIVGEFEKEPYDEFDIRLSYDDVLQDGETLSSVTLTGLLVSDESDVSVTVLTGTSGTLVSGTATGGSTTTLIDTTKNFATAGVRVGDKVYNSTKKWIARVKRIYSTTNAFDTLEFDTQSTAAAASDAYAFFFVKAGVKAGTADLDYEIRFRATTSTSRKLEDSVLMNVVDA